MRNSLGFEWTPERVERAAALRAEGKFIYEVAAILSKEWGTPLREAQVQGALRHRDKKLSGPPSPDGSGPRASAVYELGGIEVLAVDGLTAPAHPEPKPIPQPAEKEKAADTMPAAPAPELPKPEAPRDPIAPAVHTGKSRAENYICIPDLQAPFHAPGALDFCERMRREWSVPKDNLVLLGDEVDNFHGKGFDKKPDPDAEHTPRQELAAAVEELRRWYALYPNMRVCRSNHGTRYERRAAEAEISSQWMRLYREVIEAPPGWEWKDRWVIPASRQPFLAEHGHEGKSATEAKVLENGYSTIHGHFTKAQIVWVTNHMNRRLWGMCAGALIDYDTYAFRYAKKYPRRADNGIAVILDGGRIPLWVPYFS